jgi:hypothetical protein
MQPGTTSLCYGKAQYADIPCTIEISITAPATGGIGTGKAFAVSVTDMQADVAHLRRVGRGHEMHHDTSILRLIRHEGTQLVERPTVTAAAFHFCARLLVGTRPDTGQILQRYRPRGCQRVGNQVLANLMVGVALKPCFTPRQPYQKLSASAPGTSGVFRGFLLQRGTQPTIAITHRRQVLPTPVLVIAGMGDVGPSQVDAQDIVGLCGGRSSVLDLDMQEEGAIAALDQRGTGGDVLFHPALLSLTQRRFKACAGVQERQTKGPIPCPKAEDALIVVNRGGLKRRVRFALDLERRTDTGNGTNSQIGRQPKAVPDFLITGMLDLYLVAGMEAPCDLGNVVAGVRKGRQRCVKFGALLGGWRQFAGDRVYRVHRGHYVTYVCHIQRSAKAWKVFPPLPLKGRGFQRAKAQEIL